MAGALTVDLNSVGGVLVGRQRVAGPPRCTTWDWPAAQRSVGVLADLEPRVLAPGHGRPLSAGTAAALHALAQGRRRAHGRRGPGLVAAGPLRRQRPVPAATTAVRQAAVLGLALTSLGLSPGYGVTLESPDAGQA